MEEAYDESGRNRLVSFVAFLTSNLIEVNSLFLYVSLSLSHSVFVLA